jgi:hypothetical protein
MNTINVSTGFSPFQLCMGRSPRVIPPLTPNTLMDTTSNGPEAVDALALIQSLVLDVKEAQDNLLAAKVSQAEFTNRHWDPEVVFTEGEKVLLSTKYRRCEYIQKKSGSSAKFMPQFDGPYPLTKAHATKSNYTLDLPNEPNRFPTFHASQLRKFVANDDDLFPSRKLVRPGPVVTPDGEEEWYIDWIINERKCGCGVQYLVRWQGWGPEDDRWLPSRELADLEALDSWLAEGH